MFKKFLSMSVIAILASLAVPNTPAAMNATNGQAYSDTAPMSATRAGMAVPTPIASNATRPLSI